MFSIFAVLELCVVDGVKVCGNSYWSDSFVMMHLVSEHFCHLDSICVFRHLWVVGVGKSDWTSYVDFVETSM